MSPQETIGVLRSERKRVKIFVDFWNVVINARSQTSSDYMLDVCWDKLVSQIVGETRSVRHDDPGVDLAGCYIFGSFQKSDPKQKDFVSSVLDKYGATDGLYFDFRERVSKQSAVLCKNCDEATMVSSESGVDVLLTVDMIKHAKMREHDYLALVSSDRDFLPLLQYLRDEGQKVLHIATSPTAQEMRAFTWKQVNLQESYPQICRIAQKEFLVLTTPIYAQEFCELENVLKTIDVNYKTVDLTSKASIADKDLMFMIKNQMLALSHRERQQPGTFLSRPLFEDAYDLRKKLLSGELVGHFPFVLRNGEMEIYCNRNSQFRWITNTSSATTKIWQVLQKI